MSVGGHRFECPIGPEQRFTGIVALDVELGELLKHWPAGVDRGGRAKRLLGDFQLSCDQRAPTAIDLSHCLARPGLVYAG